MSDRGKLIRVASTLPKGHPRRRQILSELKGAASPREGTAKIRSLSSRGFTLYFSFTRNPRGLSTEKMPFQGKELRDKMQKFVARLSEGLDIPLSVSGESTYVLLDVDPKEKSIVFKVEAQVKNNSRKQLTQEKIEALEQSVFGRFGYKVLFI